MTKPSSPRLSNSARRSFRRGATVAASERSSKDWKDGVLSMKSYSEGIGATLPPPARCLKHKRRPWAIAPRLAQDQAMRTIETENKIFLPRQQAGQDERAAFGQ